LAVVITPSLMAAAAAAAPNACVWKNGNTPNRLKEGDTPIGQADYPDGFKAKNEKAVEKE
jgi:hypothetical protein